jgi:vitamin B12 transporter
MRFVYHAARALVTITVSLLPLFSPGTAGADEEKTQMSEVVVTASRIATTDDQVASAVTIVTQEQIQKGQYRNVIEALRAVPGLDLVQSGPVGGNAAIFLRGANSEHTLVLLDGIELNNPASTSRSFNIANLTLENVDRIEIIRGPQSTLYGSDALGGVVNIITKRAEKGTKAYASTEAGSYASFTQTAGASFSDDAVSTSVGVTRQDVGGISAASAADGNVEHDGYENTSMTGNVSLDPIDELEIALTSRYSRAGAQLDNSGGVGGDDPNRRLRNEEFFVSGQGKTHLLADTLSQTLTLSYANHDLRDRNDPDASSVDLLRSAYRGDLFKIDGNTSWVASDWVTIVVGAQTENERASSSFRSDGAFGPFEDNLGGKSARTNGIYSEARLTWSDLAAIDAGLRIDDHSIFGSATTYKIAPALYVSETTKLRATFGNGFKAPSLVQLFSSFGNQDLNAEKSRGWDLGIDQKIWGNEASISATFFRNNFDNLISFNPATFALENIASSHSQGLEVAGKWSPSDALALSLSYTYTDTEDESSGTALLRRPYNKAAASVEYQVCENLNAFVRWQGFGSRFDNDFSGATPSRVRLAGYGLIDIGATYSISEEVEVFARAENIFDREYENVLGYGNFGAAGYGGVKVSL